MKATLRIPTKESYAYIEAEMEGTIDEIIAAYFELSAKYWQKQKERENNALPF